MNLTIAANTVVPEKVESKEEVFDLLIFHNDGTVSIQTTNSSYFFATARFHAAVQLKRLLTNNSPKLEYGIEANLINQDEPPPYKCIINEELLRKAMAADQIESTHPGVIEFFSFLKEITD